MWDKLLDDFRWPAEHLGTQDTSDGDLADVVARQLQRALAADIKAPPFDRSIVPDEWGEAIEQLEQVQVFIGKRVKSLLS